jgi:GNAT superfamily N-acetyltransferase
MLDSRAMHTEFRRVDAQAEIANLLSFDREVFPAADRLDAGYWMELESYWVLIDGVTAGCCAFQQDVDFQEDIDGVNPPTAGSLLLATAGVLPQFRRSGLGQMILCWEICYARHHGFRRMVGNMRAGNRAIIELTRKLGFHVIRTTPAYYSGPVDATVVIELVL